MREFAEVMARRFAIYDFSMKEIEFFAQYAIDWIFIQGCLIEKQTQTVH
jgi:hypothetical protein